MPRVTVGVEWLRILTAQWPWLPRKGQNLQPFIGNGDVSIWVKNSQVGRKPQTNNESISIFKLHPWEPWVLHEVIECNLFYSSRYKSQINLPSLGFGWCRRVLHTEITLGSLKLFTMLSVISILYCQRFDFNVIYVMSHLFNKIHLCFNGLSIINF